MIVERAPMPVAGARFEKQANDPARPGALIWVECTVLGPIMETETPGVEAWQVSLADGSRRWVATTALRVVGS